MPDNVCLQNHILLRKFYHFLLVLLGLNLLFVISRLISSGYLFFDDIEHLRAAYFVSNGDVPYRDFFEHHHPLLWLLFAPLVSVLPHNTILAVYSGRVICFLVSLITFYYIYKLEKRFIGGKICALICLNLYFFSNGDTPTSSMFFIKPDIFMRCFWFIGLYYFFRYFHYQKFRDLNICAIAFTLSFLFLQTGIFLLIPLIVPVGYFLYKHPHRFSDFLKASLIPILMICVSLGLLCKLGIFGQYIELNWSLNRFFARLWSFQSFPYRAVSVLPILAITAIFILLQRRQTNPYWLILCLLFISELLFRIFISPADYYCMLLIIYASAIAAPLFRKNRLLYLLFFCGAVFNTFAEFIHAPLNTLTSYKTLDEEQYGLTITSGIYTERVSYYWSHPLIETIHDINFHPLQNYDINELAKQYPPQYVYFFPQWSPAEYKIFQQKLSPRQWNVFAKHYVHGTVLDDYVNIRDFLYKRKERRND